MIRILSHQDEEGTLWTNGQDQEGTLWTNGQDQEGTLWTNGQDQEGTLWTNGAEYQDQEENSGLMVQSINRMMEGQSTLQQARHNTQFVP